MPEELVKCVLMTEAATALGETLKIIHSIKDQIQSFMLMILKKEKRISIAILCKDDQTESTMSFMLEDCTQTIEKWNEEIQNLIVCEMNSNLCN